MKERSYHQYCPIAHALDLVGDRWALLVVRDLALGPKRFTDLREGLPGIGTNILTDRLKGLERADLVRRRSMPPPAASAVYELTEYGRELEETLVALAKWGGRSLGRSRPGQALSVESVMLALRAVFAHAAKAGIHETYEVRFEDSSLIGAFGVLIAGDAVEVLREAPAGPSVFVQTDLETLYNIAGGRTSMREAVDHGALRFDGDPEVATRLIDCAG